MDVVDFINRRWKKDADWTNGNCLWFAYILKHRFPSAEIYYMPIIGHFIVKIDDVFYDWTGPVEPTEKPQLLDDIREQDSLLYDRLLRDCLY